MDRDLTPDQEQESRGREPARTPEREPERSEKPRLAWSADRGLSDRQKEVLCDNGAFRTLAAEDVSNHRYKGHGAVMRDDIDDLLARGLIQQKTAMVAQGRHKLTVLVLTKAGLRAAERNRTNAHQVLYRGFVKPSEVAHDAAIYRMFHKEAAAITAKGGRILRIVLDYELKRQVYAPLAKLRSTSGGKSHRATNAMTVAQQAAYLQKQAQVARDNGLKVINGKIPLPDLRIEYETAAGERTKVDLELATHHYHGSHLAQKAQAGFKMYAADGSAGRGTKVLEEREITAPIFSL
jgi:hypothetical protein